MVTKIFVNLPVTDLTKSTEFFTKLGYTFNRQFTDENAACLVISDDIFAMLVVESYFKRFTKKKIADAKQVTEAIMAISVASRAEVDERMEQALAAGAREYRDAEEHGWMYGRSFEDPDGHQWEMIWMDESRVEQS